MRYGLWVTIAMLSSLGLGCSDTWYEDWQVPLGDGLTDWNDLSDEGAWVPRCFTSRDCSQQEVCGSHSECVPVVSGCPLTEECLQDPTMHVPEWRGVDPWYAGDIVGEDIMGRLEVDLDFRDGHIYGEGVLLSRNMGQNYNTWYDESGVFITGTRDAGVLWGQLVDADDGYRFDAVFEASMPSSSEIIGDLTIVSDDGTVDATIHLQRLSPCGCRSDATSTESETDETFH